MIMDEKKNNPQENTQEEVREIDLVVLLRDVLRSFVKLWYLVFVFCIEIKYGLRL